MATFAIIQWSAVITRSNIVRYMYYINDYRNWGRISIKCWTHKRHAIPRPHGRAMPVSFVNICEKIYRIITTPHCMWSSLDLILAHSVLTLPNHCVCELFHYSLQQKKVAMFTVLPPTQLERMPFHSLNMSDYKHNFTLTEFNRLEWCLAKQYIVRKIFLTSIRWYIINYKKSIIASFTSRFWHKVTIYMITENYRWTLYQPQYFADGILSQVIHFRLTDSSCTVVSERVWLSDNFDDPLWWCK